MDEPEIGAETDAPSTGTEVATTAERPDVAQHEHDPTNYRPAPGMNVETLMHLAIEQGGNVVEVVKELRQLRNDEMDRQAALDFHSAFAEFHRLVPPIPRDCKGKTLAAADGAGQTTLMFAGLETIQRVVDPILGPLGFAYSFTVPSATEKSLKVECVLWHKDGHSRTSQMIVPVSPIPKATPGQQFAGARTTGKRLTLSDVLGIATEDVDANEGDEVQVIGEEQVAILVELIEQKGADVRQLLSNAEVPSLRELPVSKFGVLHRWLLTRVDADEDAERPSLCRYCGHDGELSGGVCVGCSS